MTLDSTSLERLVPDAIDAADALNRESLDLHIARYRFAAQNAIGPRVLDIASGAGYGTRILADETRDAREIVGVDVDSDAIRYAQSRYATDRIRYVCADAMTFRDGESFDSIVSLETIEHLSDPAAFLRHLATLLRAGGILVTSVPTTLSSDVNMYHLHDFTAASIRSLVISLGFDEIASFPQVQPFKPFRLLTRNEVRIEGMRPGLMRYYLTHPAMAVRRALTTLRYGFSNRYLTIVWRKR